MRYPLGLLLDTAKHLVSRKLRGERRFPLVLTLEPLGAVASDASLQRNGSCALDMAVAPVSSRLDPKQSCRQDAGATKMLSVAECLAAVEECGAPVVVIRGTEPLEYPEIAALTRAVLGTRKHLFLHTGGALMRQHLHMIPPYTNFFWNVKLEGTESVHDGRTGRAGLFREALDGLKAAKNAGFFVTVTSSIYPNTDVDDLKALFERLHAMHVDGYALAPHYPAEKLCCNGSATFREKMHQRFREASDRLGAYNLMMSPVYLEYLRGERELDCSVWAGPVYGPTGWAGPCYLHNTEFAPSYKELVEETVWENYGRGLNPRCENCQCGEGFETAAILGMNGRAGDFWKKLAWHFRGSLGEKREERRQA